jgi:hypothetical protein
VFRERSSVILGNVDANEAEARAELGAVAAFAPGKNFGSGLSMAHLNGWTRACLGAALLAALRPCGLEPLN